QVQGVDRERGNVRIAKSTVNAKEDHGPKGLLRSRKHRAQLGRLEHARPFGGAGQAENSLARPLKTGTVAYRPVDQAGVEAELEHDAHTLNDVAEADRPPTFREIGPQPLEIVGSQVGYQPGQTEHFHNPLARRVV